VFIDLNKAFVSIYGNALWF